jgi:HEAT repeat protein
MVPALAGAVLREQSPTVRAALFSALTRIASPESVEAVLTFLRSDDALMRTAASDALVAMKDAAAPYFPILLRDSSADVRALACTLLRSMPSEEAARLCCDLLDAERDANVCAAAVEVLAEVGDSSALPVLARCKERFGEAPFLRFSIEMAIDRVSDQAPPPRG